MKLADLVNRHEGRAVLICGTGPSLDLLPDEYLAGPRIYLNRVAFGLPRLAGATYWLVADDAWTQKIPGPWTETLAAVKAGTADMVGVFRNPLMMPTGGNPPPEGANIVHWSGKYRPRTAVLKMDRKTCADFGLLYQHAGTAAPAIHLAYLMGAARVRLVGIDGTDGYAARLRQYYDRPARGGLGYQMSRIDAINTAKTLGIELEDLSGNPQPAESHAHAQL